MTDTQFTHLVDTVSRLHAIDADTQALATVPRERFAPVWIDDIAPAIDRIAVSSHTLYPILCAKSTALHASFRVFRTLAHTLAAMQHPMVLCHTLDRQRLRYYQGRRLFEDLIQDIQRIEGETLVDVERSSLMASIDAVSSEIIAWGVIEA